LRSGDLYLAESRRHVSFWHLVYEEPRWNQERVYSDNYVSPATTTTNPQC
jgi:hypothetical protein